MWRDLKPNFEDKSLLHATLIYQRKVLQTQTQTHPLSREDSSFNFTQCVLFLIHMINDKDDS